MIGGSGVRNMQQRVRLRTKQWERGRIFNYDPGIKKHLKTDGYADKQSENWGEREAHTGGRMGI